MELKSNELRIGNFVKDRGGKVIHIDFIEYIEKGYDCKFGQRMFLEGQEVHPMTEYTDHANPIPLTEEWLVRFGFEKDKMFFEFSIHTIRINIVLFPISPKNKEYQVRINNSTTQIFIQYVHQLQNLYHALTGKELELSPK